MKKSEEKKIFKAIVDTLGDNYNPIDDLIINDLIDWVKVSHKAKEELQESVKDGGTMSWQALTTISMCSKSLSSCFKSLGISPYERKKGKKIETKQFDLGKFLSDN